MPDWFSEPSADESPQFEVSLYPYLNENDGKSVKEDSLSRNTGRVYV